MNIAESLAVTSDEAWRRWDSGMAENLNRVQNADGSWTGNHCITGRTFCTAAVFLDQTAPTARRSSSPARATTSASPPDELSPGGARYDPARSPSRGADRGLVWRPGRPRAAREARRPAPPGLDRWVSALRSLIAGKSHDGAWRSSTYGVFKDFGLALTPTVLKAVAFGPDVDGSAIGKHRAAGYLIGARQGARRLDRRRAGLA